MENQANARIGSNEDLEDNAKLPKRCHRCYKPYVKQTCKCLCLDLLPVDFLDTIPCGLRYKCTVCNAFEDTYGAFLTLGYFFEPHLCDVVGLVSRPLINLFNKDADFLDLAVSTPCSKWVLGPEMYAALKPYALYFVQRHFCAFESTWAKAFPKIGFLFVQPWITAKLALGESKKQYYTLHDMPLEYSFLAHF